MAWTNLLFKDAREHGFAMFSLALGFVLVVFVALEQQRSGAFSMSGFEVVRFALITILPLIAFIVGNRLIVKEYVGGTRKFVEALPTRDFAPLLVKYLFGLFYLLVLCVLVVLIAYTAASAAENIDQRYLQLLLAKTCAIGLLFWSVVFFVSFTGRIRLVIYVIMGLTLMYFINKPNFDETGFAPLSLMDRQLFVFERDLIPWRDLIETGLIALLFVIAGFVLALVNEGSIAEQLGKPVSRRDFAAFALLGLGCLTVYLTLQKKWETQTYQLSGEYVMRSEAPALAISYIGEAHREQAETIFSSLSTTLTEFQTDIGLGSLPQVQLALNTEMEHTEFEPELLDGVFITSNFSNFDAYEQDLLSTFAMHHLLLTLTNGRWDYETRHWLLDGFARWWVEGGSQAMSSDNNNELFALALLLQNRLKENVNPLPIWQSIMDEFGFEAADALSYSAILYLEEIKGKDTVVQLAADYINESVGTTSVESVQRLFLADDVRFERITGLNFRAFAADWYQWLREIGTRPEVASLVDAVPRLEGKVSSVVDSTGIYRLEARYTEMDGFIADVAGKCVLRHQLASAYHQESMIYGRERDRQDCTTDGLAHSIDSPYAPGDRVYALLEFESEKFHRPIPLWVGRIHVK